jgi:hypothetical protein
MAGWIRIDLMNKWTSDYIEEQHNKSVIFGVVLLILAKPSELEIVRGCSH